MAGELVQYVQPDPEFPHPAYLYPWWPREVCWDDNILERWRVSNSAPRTKFFDKGEEVADGSDL